MKTLNQERDRVQVTAIHSDIFAPEEVASFELCQDGQDSFCGVLPENDHLRELLGMPENATVEDILRLALFNPLKELAFTRGKRVRAQLVNLGYRLVGESTTPTRATAVSNTPAPRSPGAPCPLWIADRTQRRKLAVFLAVSNAQRASIAGR